MTFYMLKHSGATIAIRAKGADCFALLCRLGHTREATSATYVRPDAEDQRPIADHFDRLLASRKAVASKSDGSLVGSHAIPGPREMKKPAGAGF